MSIDALRTHYGFTRMPFGKNIAPGMVHHHQAHDQAVARISWAINETAIGVVTGEVGAGKTLAIRTATGALDPSRHRVIYLPNPAVGTRGLYSAIVTALGGTPRFHKSALIPQATDALAVETNERNKTVTVIFDEAHMLQSEQLDEIRLLTSADMDATSPFACLLVGQPTLRQRMKLGVFAALDQRISLRCELTGMTPDETASYVAHHTALAGRTDTLFSADAVALIHQTSRGLPRGQQPCCPSTPRRLRRQHRHRRRILRTASRQRNHRLTLQPPAPAKPLDTQHEHPHPKTILTQDDRSILNLAGDQHQAPLVNFGWSIQQDCGASAADCEAPAPGFRMRTREWPNVAQRPTLSIVFQPNNDPGMQLQNVRYATCASIENGGVDGGRGIVSFGCAGRPDQLWLHTPGQASGEGQFESVTALGCIQPAVSNVQVQGCSNGAVGQRWERFGRAIRSQNNPTLCLAATSGKHGSAVGVQTCNGTTEQQWVVGPPPTSAPSPAVRLTALDAAGKATGGCADVEVRQGTKPYNRFAYEERPAQTFPCLGATRLAQQWNLGPDGRLVNRQFPAACLGITKKTTPNRVIAEQCAQGSGQLWAIEGSQIRNIHMDTCIQSGDGRQVLVLATCNSNQPGQAWSVDPADSPALVTPVQLRNNEHGDCLEPDGAVTEGRWMWTYECGGLDRPAQAFIHADTDEMVSLANPAMCLTRDGALMVRECASIYGAKEGRQLWTITELSQLQLSGSNCVRGNGNLQRLTLVGCATSVNNIDPAQQWSPEELGTTTSVLRQMRNLDSGSCADLRSGVNAIAWPCSGADREIQGVLLAKVGNEYEVRTAANPGQCLDVQSNGNENAAVRPINCNYGPFQRWTLSEDGQLKTSSPGGRCLQGGLDNAPLAMRTCNPDAGSNAAQRWEFEDATDTRELRQIRNVESGSCLDVLGTVTQGQAYTGVPCSGEDRPNQAFVQLNNGAFASAASDTNLCIDGGGANGNEMLPWGCKNPAQNHEWRVNGSLFRQGNSGRCAELNPGSNRSSVQPCDSSRPYQAWAVEDVSGTASSTLQFRNADNGCLDIAGATRAGYSNNDRLVVMPCLGSARTNQSFRLMSNGMIRSTGTPGQCLDAAGTSGPLLWTCADNNINQRWKLDGGRIMNVTAAGQPRNGCIQGGPDGAQAILAACSGASNQQWVAEAHGLNKRHDAVGRLRTSGDNLCLETEGLQGNQSQRIRGGPCVASGKTEQRFVRLNTGQFRPVAQLGFCMNANGNGNDAVPNTIACPIGSTNTALEWVIDSNGWLSSANSQLCIEAPGSGWLARQRACAVDPIKANQQWVFEAGTGL